MLLVSCLLPAAALAQTAGPAADVPSTARETALGPRDVAPLTVLDGPRPQLIEPSPPEVPAAVLDAVTALNAACRGWHWYPAIYEHPSPYPPEPPERIVCASAADPEGQRQTGVLFGVGVGAALTVAFLLAAGVLRVVLLSLWMWRPRPRWSATGQL